MTSEEAAYIAGFVDGEGCISCHYKSKGFQDKRRFRAALSIGQVHKGTLEWIRERTGGSLQGPYFRKDYQPFWHLVIQSKALDALLPQILPFLIQKAEKAKAVMELRGLMRAAFARGKRLSDEELARRFELVALTRVRAPKPV